MAISDQTFDLATAPGADTRQGGYVVTAEYDVRQERLSVGLSTGVIVMVPVHLMEDLAGASAEDLAEIEITPSGLGLHWPRLDADVYVPALLQGVFGSRRWMAAELGASGGRASTAVKSAAKSAAARETVARAGGRASRLNPIWRSAT